MTRQTNTRDIGLAFRDFMEGQRLKRYDDTEEVGEDVVEFVDVSDPSNPICYMADGATFTVRIFAGGGDQ